MLSKSLSGTVAAQVLTALITSGHLTNEAIRVMFIHIVRATFDEANVSSIKKINCIKAVRQCMGTGLLDAKNFVERFETRMVNRKMLMNRIEQFAWDDVDRISVPEVEKMMQESSHLKGIDVDALKQAVIEELIDSELAEY